jgi:arabinose-5-phosphate isomerase
MESVDHRRAWLISARTVMETEARAILTASDRLQTSFLDAVDVILGHPGKLIVTGMGKSGHVAQKIVATLRSTGTPSVFLHPVEAAHGDLGLCQPGDPILMISKSGATAELIDLVPPLRALPSRFIGILGNVASPLAAEMDVVLDASVQREADPESFTPTASSAVALALGHALAIALMQARGFTAAQFGRYHPEGQLGRNLRIKVSQIMHSGNEVAWVRPEDSLKQVVIAMSARPLGAACVVSEGNKLAGLITDGDLRRALQRHDDIRLLCAADVMTPNPIAVGPDSLVHDALCLMEDRPSQISVLPVVDASGRCAGLIRLHDMYHPSWGSK